MPMSMFSALVSSLVQKKYGKNNDFLKNALLDHFQNVSLNFFVPHEI